jgi:hypothetical protein
LDEKERIQQRKWLVAQDLVSYRFYNDRIGNLLVEPGNSTTKTPAFNDISIGDKIFYYAYPEKTLVGLFEVISKKKFCTKEECHNGDDPWAYYNIKPIEAITHFTDISKLSIGEDKFDSFPNGLLSEKFDEFRGCKELSETDFLKLKYFNVTQKFDKVFSKENNVAIFSAVLEFYGNRATSFVSLFVASIFGIVTLSAIIQVINSPTPVLISTIPYFIFSLAGFYTLQRFFYYVDLAEKVKTNCLEIPNYFDLNINSVFDSSTKESIGFSDYVVRNAKRKPILKRILDYTIVFPLVYFATLLLLGIVVYWNNGNSFLHLSEQISNLIPNLQRIIILKIMLKT